jgi:hydroxypyruvate isomerase
MLQRALVRSVRKVASSSATRSGLPILLHKQLKLNRNNQKNTTIINSINSDNFAARLDRFHFHSSALTLAKKKKEVVKKVEEEIAQVQPKEEEAKEVNYRLDYTKGTDEQSSSV